MSIALDTLQSAVAAERDAEVAAMILQEGLQGQLDACGTDLTKLGAFTSDWKASTAALAEAVVANTARQLSAAEKDASAPAARRSA